MTTWEDFRDKHHNQTGLIICNGPSLSTVPVEFLRKYPSIGTNGIYLLPFQPDYYVAVNKYVLNQFEIENNVEGQKFIKRYYASRFSNALPLVSSYKDGSIFSKSPDKWVYEGGTVTYVALQIAFFMGFSTILLVGLDHYYQNSEGYPNQVRIMREDNSHFTKDYFKKGMVWNLPDLFASENSYREAQRVYQEAGRRIINLSNPTAETIFEKGRLEDY